jgi:hypothetical protein
MFQQGEQNETTKDKTVKQYLKITLQVVKKVVVMDLVMVFQRL